MDFRVIASSRAMSFRADTFIRDAEVAFNDAIAAGRLTTDPTSIDYETRGETTYAGNWMYMYSIGDEDYFKNIERRHYITSRIPSQRGS